MVKDKCNAKDEVKNIFTIRILRMVKKAGEPNKGVMVQFDLF